MNGFHGPKSPMLPAFAVSSGRHLAFRLREATKRGVLHATTTPEVTTQTKLLAPCASVE